MSEFAENLKRFRKSKKLTQTELGKMLNYGSTAIANYESGRNEPSIDDLIKIADDSLYSVKAAGKGTYIFA